LKSLLKAALEEECAKSEGCQQTFTLIEWARENIIQLIEDNSDVDITAATNTLSLDDDDQKVLSIHFSFVFLTHNEKQQTAVFYDYAYVYNYRKQMTKSLRLK